MRWSASVALLIALCVLSLSALAQPATEAEGPDESAEGPQSIEDLDPADIEKAYGIACEAAGMELDPTPYWQPRSPDYIRFVTPRDIVPRESFGVNIRTWRLSMHGRDVMENPPPPTVEEIFRLVRAEAMRFLPEELASAMHFRVNLWVGGELLVLCEVPSWELPPVGPIAPCWVCVVADARAVSQFIPLSRADGQEQAEIPFHQAAANLCDRLGVDPAAVRFLIDPRGDGTQLWALGSAPVGNPHWSLTFETPDLNGAAEVDARTGEVTYVHTHRGPTPLAPLDTEITGEGHPRSTGWYYFDEAGDMIRAEDPKWYRLDAEGNLVLIPDEERAAPADEAPEIEIVPDEEEILG
jgi:hypothetical protein